ncbi:TPM domain-containing protein [Sinomonas sp. B1-1]|uniref:TPM domain-containing protein n=1 Tax=Sinomonas sp. B1-1 TaxID=3141454 RepID=UPI003D293EF4
MRSTAKTLLSALAAALLMLFPATAAAWATDPVTIPSGTNVVDPQGALGGRKDEVQKAIGDLLSQHRINLYVVIVDSFTNPGDRTEWAKAVAKNKGMGSADVLLAIATAGQYEILANTQNTKVYSKISAIAQNAVTPNLAGGKRDFAQAAIDTAKAVGDAAGGGSGTPSSGAGAAPWLIGGGVVVAGAAGAYLIARRRRGPAARQGGAKTLGPREGERDPLAGLSVAELRTKANGLLVRADDAIRSSEQELGFAEASYGTEAVGAFTKALADAKAHMGESFKLQQQLDDHVPDTEEQQRTWLGEIIRRSEAAIASLAEQKADFDALRELERNAPSALNDVASGSAEANSRLVAAEAELGQLRAKYADSALKHVADNITQAKERLAFVENASSTARQKLADGETSPAAVAVRAAEEALHQARVLLDAIDKAASSLDDARTSLDAALADTQGDLAQAKALAGSGQHPELTGPIAAVDAALGQVQQELSASPKIDPVAALGRVEAAHQQLDEALTGVRDRQQQVQRAEASLQQAVASAQAQIGAASDYIAARRGGVGTEARTRLAEAQRNLDYALSISRTDPVTALAYAQQANALAAQAAQIAQQDVDQFAGWGGGPGYGGMFGGRRDGGGIAGAVLGGIIINSILSGGHHHSGGGGWGDGGGFGGGWGGGGGGFDSGFGGGGDFGGDGGSF